MKPSYLSRLMQKHFNESEFRDLCLELGVNYGRLGGASTADKIRELILLVIRDERISELLVALRQVKSRVRWPNQLEVDQDVTEWRGQGKSRFSFSLQEFRFNSDWPAI